MSNADHCPTCWSIDPKHDHAACNEEWQRAFFERRAARKNRILPVPGRYAEAKLYDLVKDGQITSALAGRIKAHVAALYDDQGRRRSTGGIIIAGTANGTGKTHLACAALNYAATLGHTIAFASGADLLAMIKATFDKPSGPMSDETDYIQSEAHALDTVDVADWLCLDDFGDHKATEWAETELRTIINRRYEEGRPTIITTNFTSEQLNNTPHLRAIISRLNHDAIVLKLEGEDRRRGKKNGDAPKDAASTVSTRGGSANPSLSEHP